MGIEIIRGAGFSLFSDGPDIEGLDCLDDNTDMEPGRRPSSPTTIAIIEKRPMAGECLSRSICEIEPGYAVYVYSSLRAWHQSAAFSRSSLVLLCAPRAGSTEAEAMELERELDLLRLLGVQVPIAVLADCEDAGYISRLIEHGVRCYISSNLSVYMAVRSMQFAIDGGISIPSASLLSILKSQMPSKVLSVDDELDAFTSRQKEIIKAIQQGKQNKEIAHDLSMSEGTVKVHVHNIMRKLKAKNRTEVAIRLKGGVFD